MVDQAGLGRVALITGGGTGIGAAIAQSFAAEGWRVAIVGRRQQALSATADVIRRHGGRVLELAADITRDRAPQDLIDTVVSSYGGLDALVNNAATIRIAPIDAVTPEVLDHHVAVNWRAPYLLTQAALPALRNSDAPCVLNISSSSGVVVRPHESLYGSTKAALNYLTKSLAAELAPQGVRVNAIVPGPVDTPIHASYSSTNGSAELRRLLPQIPLGRVGRPHEIAQWAVLLCRPNADWVTGVVLPIDGGQTLDFR